MANIPVKQADSNTVYLAADGIGTDGQPYVPQHTIYGQLPAGLNNIGDMDVLSFVGDSADLDSIAGVDNHAVVAIGMPAAGGHVVATGDATNGLDVDVTRIPEWSLLDVVTSAPITYVGKQQRSGAWLVQKVDETSGVQVRYAGLVNNGAVADYATAWAGRAGLTYGLYSEAVA